MEITKNKNAEVFCIFDDFCQEYEKEIATRLFVSQTGALLQASTLIDGLYYDLDMSTRTAMVTYDICVLNCFLWCVFPFGYQNWLSKKLQKSSAIQKISVTLSSVIVVLVVCKLLIFANY